MEARHVIRKPNASIVLLAIFAIITILADSIAQAEPAQRTLTIAGDPMGEEIAMYADFFEDPSNQLELSDVIKRNNFQSNEKSILSFSYSDSSYWFRLNVSNITQIDRKLIILLDYPMLDEIIFYDPILDAYQQTLSGDVMHFGARKVPYRSFAFNFGLAPNSQKTLYLKVKTSSILSFSLRIWDVDKFSQFKTQDIALIFFLYGLVCSILLYNFFIYISIKSRAYLCYVLFLIGGCYFSLCWTGIGKQFLWNDSVWLTQRGWPTSSCVLAFTVYLFQLTFFRLHTSLPKIYNLYLSLLVVCFLAFIACFFISIKHANILGVCMGATCGLISYSVAIKLASIGVRQAWFFIIAWAAFAMSVAVGVLNVMGYSNFSFYSVTYIVQMSMACEAILLSLALADRIKEINLAFANSAKKELHLANQLKKVVYPHQVKLVGDGHELETTMPTGPSEACVVCFDIIGSSKIQHVNAKDFFRNVFQKCNALMSEGYDGLELRSNAYRIKEMGDGFLCSIGYPFKSTHDSIVMGALELAYKFEEIFRREAERLDYSEPIHCGIGIAVDSISGFYPESGAKEYDLYGRAIILATRYEEMRKKILSNRKPASILVLQEKVFMSLNSTSRTEFLLYDLKENGVEVRDDPNASKLYFKILTATPESAKEPSSWTTKRASSC